MSLLAPAGPGAALLGPGLSSVGAVLDWNDPAFVSLFAERGAPDAAVAERLRPFEACVAYTAREALVAQLARHIPGTVPFGPRPVGVHAADWFAVPTRDLGAEPPLLPPDLQPVPAEEMGAAQFLAGRLAPGFLAIHPGSGGPAKNWPRERYALLTEALGAGAWLLVEGPADAEAAALLAQLPGCVRARGLSVRTLGAILRLAGVFVGNDSGVTHLAAAWGAPTLALFGPTDPAVWSPVGRRVAVVRSPTPAMVDLAVPAVVAAALRLRVGGVSALR